MLSAIQVAEYLLSLEEEEAGDTISNLKLQKLLYYAQGYHLALFGEPLFAESIKKWTHGPVVPQVWHQYRENRDGSIPIPKDINFDIYDDTTQDFLKEIHRVLGQYSAWKLRNMTHEEPPWIEASKNGEISHEAMTEYFSTQISGARG